MRSRQINSLINRLSVEFFFYYKELPSHLSRHNIIQLFRVHDRVVCIRSWPLYKKETLGLLLTATHSLRSSPSGNATAFRKLPEPNVAAACFIKSYWWVPSGIFFFGLNVLLDLEPLEWNNCLIVEISFFGLCVFIIAFFHTDKTIVSGKCLRRNIIAPPLLLSPRNKNNMPKWLRMTNNHVCTYTVNHYHHLTMLFNQNRKQNLMILHSPNQYLATYNRKLIVYYIRQYDHFDITFAQAPSKLYNFSQHKLRPFFPWKTKIKN